MFKLFFILSFFLEFCSNKSCNKHVIADHVWPMMKWLGLLT